MAHADKRTPSTDALETLGTIIDDQEKRDAIHLAVIPIQAGIAMEPGEHIKIAEGNRAMPTHVGEGIGIVDPFLARDVLADEWFWLVVYPRKITSLRHVWTHPELPDTDVIGGTVTNILGESMPAAPVPSEAQLQKTRRLIDGRLQEAYNTVGTIAAEVGVEVDELLDAGDNWEEHGEYGEYLPDHFWPAYEIIRDVEVKDDDRGSFFTCSC